MARKRQPTHPDRYFFAMRCPTPWAWPSQRARGGLCQRHEVCSCARSCACVPRLRACWRAEACSDGAQRNRAWAGVLAPHRGGRRAGFSLHCAVRYSGKSCRRVVVCFACVCGVLCGAASWPLGYLRCQRMRVLLWSVCLSVVRWVPW